MNANLPLSFVKPLPPFAHRAYNECVGVSLLLIDDDTELCSLMEEFFAGQGLRLKAVHDGRQGLELALHGGFDAILLDVMLPGMDGFSVLGKLRERSEVPVLMLTARTEQSSRIHGLEHGADDYLPKPFDPYELAARVRAVLRRAGNQRQPHSSTALEANRVRLDPGTLSVPQD